MAEMSRRWRIPTEVETRAAVHVFPGEQKVIRGFDEGVTGMKPGEVRASVNKFAPQLSRLLILSGSACELIHGEFTVCPADSRARSPRWQW